MSSHHVKHTARSVITRALRPLSSHYYVASFGIQPDPYPITVQARSSIFPNVPKITIAQAASPVHIVSSYQRPPPLPLPTATIHVSACITVSKPSTAICILSFDSRRIWRPANRMMTLRLRTYSTWIASCRWIDSCRRTSSMQMDSWLAADDYLACRWTSSMQTDR